MPERILALSEPLSFWGGLDPTTGEIIDVHHPQRGENVTGVILFMPKGRGSSSSPSVLAEALRLGHGPSAIVLEETDPIVWLGAFVAELLYGVSCPVTVREPTTADR
ncbi:MAG: aconitase X swivel domain-containing protein [Acidimicrobiia bacterium]